MKKTKLPQAESIQKLAEFWDRHDLTSFDDQLEEVSEPIFVRANGLEVSFEPEDIAAVKRLAKSKGISPEQLIRSWVLNQIARTKSSRPAKRSA